MFTLIYQVLQKKVHWMPCKIYYFRCYTCTIGIQSGVKPDMSSGVSVKNQHAYFTWVFETTVQGPYASGNILWSLSTPLLIIFPYFQQSFKSFWFNGQPRHMDEGELIKTSKNTLWNYAVQGYFLEVDSLNFLLEVVKQSTSKTLSKSNIQCTWAVSESLRSTR